MQSVICKCYKDNELHHLYRSDPRPVILTNSVCRQLVPGACAGGWFLECVKAVGFWSVCMQLVPGVCAGSWCLERVQAVGTWSVCMQLVPGACAGGWCLGIDAVNWFIEMPSEYAVCREGQGGVQG